MNLFPLIEVYGQYKLECISYYFFFLSEYEVEGRERWGPAWEELRGGIEDVYNQNTLYQILKELIKIFLKKSQRIPGILPKL